jgi:hypothetical protein
MDLAKVNDRSTPLCRTTVGYSSGRLALWDFTGIADPNSANGKKAAFIRSLNQWKATENDADSFPRLKEIYQHALSFGVDN